MEFNKLYLSLIFSVNFLFLAAFLFAWVGFFYAPLILALTLGAILILLKKKTLPSLFAKKEIDRWNFLALFAVSLICLFTFLQFSPSYLGGRDQGAMVEAAVMLAKNHQLEFNHPTLSIFNNKGSDDLALNYPGFIITENNSLKTQFNIGYVSYLAFWYSLLGETGLKIANLFGVFLGFLAIFLIVKKISKNAVTGLASLALLFLSFPFFWYSKQNLAEIMAFSFLFTAIYCLINFYQNPKNKKFSGFLSLFSLFCFSLIRIEGMVVIALALLVIYKIAREKKIAFFNKQMIFLLLLGATLFIAYSFSILPFYKKMIKDIVGYQREKEALSFQFSSLKENFLRTNYIFSVLFKYGLSLIVLLGLFNIIITGAKLIFGKIKLISKSFLPLILGGVFLIYFIKPTISLDHPWVLRRFMFAVIPLLIIYSVLLISKTFKNKQLAFVILALMTIFQANLFLEYGFAKKNPLLIKEIENLTRTFEENDLILVDKSSSPDNWSLISEPMRYLFDKNAVYIYNPQDIEKISRQDFNKIYLFSGADELNRYENFIDPNSNSKKIFLNFKQLKVDEFDKKTDYTKPIKLPPLLNEKKMFYLVKLDLDNQ
jgi:hypothetical protein